MSVWSANLKLPYLAAAQAQKHVTHNSALERLDAIVQLTVVAFDATTPPVSMTEGAVWALGVGATNDWAGHDGDLAVWSNGGWLFVTPRIGWRAAQAEDLRIFDGTAWVLPSLPELQNLPGVGVNTTYDANNPLAVSGAATLLTHAGAGHRLKINKAAPGDTASVVFQTGWSGRAEFGIVGADDFAMKVSPDGTTWTTALTLAAASGRARFGTAAELPDGNVTAPALCFANAPDAGFFHVGADTVGATAGGVQQWQWNASGFQMDVPLTGTAVQADATDATGGRVMTTGAFGLGAAGATPEVSDLDAIAAPGFYRIQQANAAAGHAPGGSCDWIVLHHQFDASAAVQVAWEGSNTSARAWQRVKAGGTWQVWACSTSYGGSNANGWYLRLPDGTQTCVHSASSFLSSDSPKLNLFGSASEATWVFPAAFAGPNILVHCSPRTGSPVWGRGRPTGSSTAGLTLFSASPVSQTLTCDLLAFGRWF